MLRKGQTIVAVASTDSATKGEPLERSDTKRGYWCFGFDKLKHHNKLPLMGFLSEHLKIDFSVDKRMEFMVYCAKIYNIRLINR